VEISASGAAGELERFLADVRHGPSGARVDAVRQLPPDESDHFGDEFHVLR
jgi:hypothetical protein